MIEIPDAVMDAALVSWLDNSRAAMRPTMVRALSAVGPLIVAAELRRLAEWLACDDGTREDILRRADELDPQDGESW